jgi:hypothetical protein
MPLYAKIPYLLKKLLVFAQNLFIIDPLNSDN